MIVGTDKGQIKVYGMPSSSYANLAFDSFNAHIGEVVKIMCSPDGRFVFSAGADGTIFVYSVTEYASEGLIYKQEVIVTSAKEDQAKNEQTSNIISSNATGAINNSSNLQLVVDEHLAQIVMVQKSVMEDWRKQQESLKQEMEEENNKVESSLRQEKYKYEQSITVMEKTKTDQLNDLNKRYEDLQVQEAE